MMQSGNPAPAFVMAQPAGPRGRFQNNPMRVFAIKE